MTFDGIIANLLLVCERHPGFHDLAKVCAVRDLQGRIRLVADPGRTPSPCDLDALTTALTAALGSYFVGPILTTTGSSEERRVAQQLFRRSEDWPPAWDVPFQDPLTGESLARRGPWRALQRLHSKEAWLSAKPTSPPWELRAGQPPIISFYSFKGGVGRTTLLGATARYLAKETKKRVVVVDLDLEAPGLGSFLEADTERGVLDFVLDYLVTAQPDLNLCTAAARALGDEEGNRVTVIPAGRMTWAFIEKLGRLDFAAGGPLADEESPVSRALFALLATIRRQLDPDYILIDSRAGLHDLGGLSLHALAHIDVVVSRANVQNLDGLDLALHALGRRKTEEALRRLVIAQSFAPRRQRPDEPSDEERTFRQDVYDLFLRRIYTKIEPEDRDAADAPHYPWPIFHDQNLERLNSIRSVPANTFDGLDFQQFFRRLIELCAPETGAKNGGAGESGDESGEEEIDDA